MPVFIYSAQNSHCNICSKVIWNAICQMVKSFLSQSDIETKVDVYTTSILRIVGSVMN